MNQVQKIAAANGIKVGNYLTLQSSSEKAMIKRFENSITQSEIVLHAKKLFEGNKALFSPITKIDEFFTECFGITKAYAYRLIKLAENLDKLPEFRALCKADKSIELGVNGFNKWLNNSDKDETSKPEIITLTFGNIQIKLKPNYTKDEINKAIEGLQAL